MSNPIEQKLANLLGAQQLEIIRLQGVVEICQEEIARLQKELAERGAHKADTPEPEAPTANGHDGLEALPN